MGGGLLGGVTEEDRNEDQNCVSVGFFEVAVSLTIAPAWDLRHRPPGAWVGPAGRGPTRPGPVGPTPLSPGTRPGSEGWSWGVRPGDAVADVVRRKMATLWRVYCGFNKRVMGTGFHMSHSAVVSTLTLVVGLGLGLGILWVR